VKLASNSAVMVHDFEDGDVAKTKIWMLHCLDISNQDGGDDLAAECVLDVSVELEYSQGNQLATVDLGNEWSGSRVGMRGVSRWFKRYLERFADRFDILFWGDSDSQMG
jgi:hypothetical protein